MQIVRHIDASEYHTIIDRLPATRLVQVIHVEDETAIGLIKQYEPFVHAFLLDSGRPSVDARELGGSGRTHNWEISAKIVSATQLPVFLAGGLTPENVRNAVEWVSPFGLDLCSGVRTSKDLDERKLSDFVRRVERLG